MGQSVITVKKFLDSLGKPIGEGKHHKVYVNPANTCSVIKTGKYVLEHAAEFIKKPDFFPIVYDVINCGTVEENYIVIEKLDHRDFLSIFKKIFSNNDYSFRSEFLNYETFTNIRSIITNKDQLILLDRIYEIVINTNIADIRSLNFGYDKNGKIKALDL